MGGIVRRVQMDGDTPDPLSAPFAQSNHRFGQRPG